MTQTLVPPIPSDITLPDRTRPDFYMVRMIDVETTDGEPPDCEVIEVGWVDIWFPCAGGTPLLGDSFSTFVKPSRAISVEAMAVHHITEEMAAGGISQEELKDIIFRGFPDCFAAHNSKFEAALLDTRGLPWLCTYKSALRVYPDAPRHTNQVLRYALSLAVDPVLSQPPHRAGPDAYVSAFLLAKLSETASIEEMVQWTSEPARFKRINFGKHRGKLWSEVDDEYLRWMNRQPDFDQDTVWNLKNELERRQVTRSKPQELSGPADHETTCSPV